MSYSFCDSVDYSPPGSSVLGISLARILEITPGNLPDPGIELTPPTSIGGFFTSEPPGKPIPFITYGITGCLWRYSIWSVFLPIKTRLYKNPSNLDLTLQHIAIFLVLQF